MEPAEMHFVNGDLGGELMPSQYNDMLGRRSSGADGEYLLLWAVLEDAIRTYLANKDCSTLEKRRAFHEVRRWFECRDKHHDLFAFPTICDLLGIEPDSVIRRIDSPEATPVSRRRRRVSRKSSRNNLAA